MQTCTETNPFIKYGSVGMGLRMDIWLQEELLTFITKNPWGAWINDGFDGHWEDDEAELVEYEIDDNTLTMDQGGRAIVWTKSS